MLTLSQLLRLTPLKIRQNAGGVSAFLIKTVTDIKAKIQFKLCVCSCTGNTIPRYTVFKLMDPAKGVNSPVWVTCSCEYWLFNCEVAVAKRGSTDILKSNGDNPNVRNPDNIPHLCKHLVAAANIAIKSKPTKVTKKTLKALRRTQNVKP